VNSLVQKSGPRIVLRDTDIRIETKKRGKYELLRSYRLLDEADAALRAISELKTRGKR
jgi:hypothetical protein